MVNRPVIIHRAILGSLERFIAIITEHFAGKWPFWLSPRQVLVIPVTGVINGYAQKVADELSALGIYTDVDLGPDTLNKKIRNGEIAQYNFILGTLAFALLFRSWRVLTWLSRTVVGQEELDSKSVNVRNRDDQETQDRGQPISLDEAVEKLCKLRDDKGNYNPFPAVKKAAPARPAATPASS